MNKAKEKRKRAVVSAKRMAETSTGRSSRAYTLPSDAGIFIVKKDTTYEIDIIPYEAKEGNPHGDPGSLVPGRTYMAHGSVGPNNETWACPAQFNKPCPICEYRAKNARDPNGDDKLDAKLRPKRRQLWNVVDTKNPAKGVQIWDISAFCFGDPLFKKIDRNPKHETFADPDEGFTLHVGVQEKDGGGFKFLDCSDIEFHKRDEPVSDKLLDSAHPLDDLLICPDYDALRDAFQPGEGNDTANKPAADTAAFEVGDTVDHPEHGICEIVHISGDGTSIRLKDSDGELHRAIDPADCAPAEKEEDEDEPTPAKKASKTAAKAADPDEDDEDDDDKESEDEDDEPEDDEDADTPVYALGDWVEHEDFGRCEVIRLGKDGTLVLEDAEEEMHKGIDPADVTAAKASKAPAKAADPDDDDEDGDEDDEPTPPRKAPAKAAASAKGKDLPFDDEDEDDEPQPAKKPAKAPAKKPGKK